MKNLFLLFFAIFTCMAAKADPWEDVTEKQAASIVKFLKKNPFILDYCDCCDEGDVYLLKVVSTKIVPCSHDETKKTVIANVLRIAKLETGKDGTPTAYRAKTCAEPEQEFIISMNYTFVFSKRDKWAVPFFKEIPYEQDHVCKGATRYPNPAENENIKDAEYKKWFAKRKIK